MWKSLTLRQDRVNPRVVKKPRSEFAANKREHLNRGMQHQQLAFLLSTQLRLNREVLASNALLVWTRLMIAYCTKQTIYQVKHGLLKIT